MPNSSKSKKKSGSKRSASVQPISENLKPELPNHALSTTLMRRNGGLRVQASLDHVAESIGGVDVFLDACRQSGSKEAMAFLTLWRSLPAKEQLATTLQDLCTRLDFDATDLVGSIMGKLIMQSNNVALLKAAISRPHIMDANIAIALGDDELALQAQKVHFQMAGFLKGEGTQVVNLTQNVQGTGMMSFEEAAHQTVASVKLGGVPVPPITQQTASVEADSSAIEAEVE